MLSDDMLLVIIVDDGVVAEAGRSNRLGMLAGILKQKENAVSKEDWCECVFLFDGLEEFGGCTNL